MFKKLFFICYLIPIISLSQENQKDSTYVKKLMDEAYSNEAKNPKKALEIYKEVIHLSNEIDYPVGTFKATQYSGIVHSDMSNYDSALYYYKKSLPLSDLAKDERGKGAVYINMGNVYLFKGKLDHVPDYYLKGIEYLEKANDSSAVANTYMNLAALFQTLKQPEKQIQYLLNSIPQMPKSDIQTLGYSYANLGGAYQTTKEYEKSLKFLNLADSITKLGNYPGLDFITLSNFGNYYYTLRSFEKAVVYFEDALEKGDETKDEYFKNELILSLGNCYTELGNYNESISYLEKALEMGKRTKALEIQSKATRNLAYAYGLKNDKRAAYEYQKLHMQLKDSLYDINKLKAVNDLEIKYETEKKDKEIVEQQLALQKSKSRTSMLSIIAISSVLGIILIWFSFLQRQKRKNQEILALKREHQVKTLESLIEGEEKERHRIAQELHDGVNGDLSAIKFKLSSLLDTNKKTIQEAMNMIDRSCEQVRAISHNLIPPSLEDFNLIEAIYEFTEKMNNLHPIDISFFHIGEMIEISKKSELNIFRIIQELVGNSIKHSEGSEINVQLSTINEMIQISVEDDGKGFDTKSTNGGGIGLKNIQSRVDYLNAMIDVDSTDKGTSYVIEILKSTLDDN